MKYRRKRGLHEATLDGSDTVLLDVETSKYYDLNLVASRIWQLLEQPRSPDELCETLQDEFDVDPADCKAQVEAFLKQMCDKGLCESSRP